LTSLTENSTDPTSFIFIYEKDGVTKEFTEDDELPYEEEGWTFKERRDIFPEYNDRNTEKERNFHLWDVNGEEDVTSDVILTQGNQIILTIPDLSKVTTALTWKINSLQDWCEQHDIDILAAVSGSAEEIGIWSDLSMPEYPIYTADDTVIKELVRGNPGIVFLRDGKIVWKSTLDALDADDFMSDRIGDDPMSFSYDADTVLHRYILIYAVFLVILIAMSFTSRIIRKYGK
jgi:triosephosphate isomerase